MGLAHISVLLFHGERRMMGFIDGMLVFFGFFFFHRDEVCRWYPPMMSCGGEYPFRYTGIYKKCSKQPLPLTVVECF